MQVSVVIPTKDEEVNIFALLAQLLSYLNLTVGKYETIVVDDSTDRTAETAEKYGARVIRGKGEGLGQAIIDGIKVSQGNIVVVMDSDGSHRVQDIPKLIKPLLERGYDMTIGSRYIPGGTIVGWNFKRKVVSRLACLLALPITGVKDSTSGFFAFKKSLLQGVELKPSSWKIMLEVLIKANPLVLEVPITFGERHAGKSKFSKKQIITYIKHLGLLALYKYRKVINFFMIAGLVSAFIFGLTYFLTEVLNWWYMFSMFIASLLGVSLRFLAEAKLVFSRKVDTNSADYEWNAFFKGSLIQRWWKQSIAKTIWTWIPSGSSLLDIGCGSSPTITHYPGAVGVDTNRAKLDFIRNKCSTVATVEIAADNLKFDKDSFDYILCIELLEHLPNPESTITSISRILKPNGKVIIATPDYSKKLWLLAEKFTPYKEQHTTQFTKESLELLCKTHNLTPIKHRYIAGCDLVELFEKSS